MFTSDLQHPIELFTLDALHFAIVNSPKCLALSLAVCLFAARVAAWAMCSRNTKCSLTEWNLHVALVTRHFLFLSLLSLSIQIENATNYTLSFTRWRLRWLSNCLFCCLCREHETFSHPATVSSLNVTQSTNVWESKSSLSLSLSVCLTSVTLFLCLCEGKWWNHILQVAESRCQWMQ